MTHDSLFPLAWTQLWQLTFLSLTTLALTRWLARDRPHLAHALWLVVLLKCLTPPVCTSPGGVFCWVQTWLPKSARQLDSTTPPASIPITALPIASRSVRHQEMPRSTSRPASTQLVADQMQSRSGILWPTWGRPALLVTWLGGIATILGVAAVRWWLCWRVVRMSPREQREDLVAEVDRLRERLGVRTAVRLVVTASRIGPAVFGLWRPTILLPACIARNKSSAELAPILAHELIHIRRGDLWVGLVQVLAQAVWWFHPLVWLTNRLLSRDAERCCDEEVLAGLNEAPAHYARCLLDVLELKRHLRPVPVFPGVRSVEITSQRLERIMRLGQGCHKRSPWWCWLVLALFSAATLPGAAFTATEEQANPSASNRPSLTLPPPADPPREWQRVPEAALPKEGDPRCAVIEVHFIQGTMPFIDRLKKKWTSAEHPSLFTNGTMDPQETTEFLGMAANYGQDLCVTASPKITVPFGQTATVHCQDRESFVVAYRQGADSTLEPVVRDFSTGVNLQVLARECDGGEIDLECTLEVSAVGGRGKTQRTRLKPGGEQLVLQCPTWTKRTAQLSRRLPSAHALVIPGLVDTCEEGQTSTTTSIVIRCQKLAQAGEKETNPQPRTRERSGTAPGTPAVLPNPAARTDSAHHAEAMRDAKLALYHVADLVIPIPQNVSLHFGTASSLFTVAESQASDPPANADIGSLAQHIQRTIEPSSWSTAGGVGMIKVIPGSHTIMVMQSPAVQQKIAGLLKSLRALQNHQLVMEFHVVPLPTEASPNAGERVDDAGETTRTRPAGKLSATEVRELLARPSTENPLALPKVTLFQGQTLELTVGGEARQMTSRIRPVISPSGRSVTLLATTGARGMNGTKEALSVIEQALADDESLLLDLPIEITAKDLGLGHVQSQSSIEQIPYLGALLKKTPHPTANQRLGLLVTPRVVYVGEEEDHTP